VWFIRRKKQREKAGENRSRVRIEKGKAKRWPNSDQSRWD